MKPAPEPTIKSLELTDNQISKLFRDYNFGTTGTTPEGRRRLMVECVFKWAAGYSDGSTITGICAEVGLVDRRHSTTPTDVGLRWAFDQIYKGGQLQIVSALLEASPTDSIAYEETKSRVANALDNCSYGAGLDAVRGAREAVEEWAASVDTTKIPG